MKGSKYFIAGILVMLAGVVMLTILEASFGLENIPISINLPIRDGKVDWGGWWYRQWYCVPAYLILGMYCLLSYFGIRRLSSRPQNAAPTQE